MDDDDDCVVEICPACTGVAAPFGHLGSRPYFQCKGCGTIFSVSLNAA